MTFHTVAIIGIGLIGSSLARVLKARGLAERVVCCDSSADARATALRLGIVDAAHATPEAATVDADLTVICTPTGAYAAVAQAIMPTLRPGAILSDVGSVKQAPIAAITPHLKPGVAYVPGHPVAGTENSGPASGFAELFEGRWAILTPPEGTDGAAVDRVQWMWQRAGSRVARMSADHHDRVLAITSHLPHLIAYTIVGTATDLEDHLKGEVIKYSAGGFRDFTRIAASDPVMWRDIFLANREAVLELLQRFSEDLTALQRAIRRGEGNTLEDLFTRTRAIRRSIIEAKQA